MIIKRHRQRVPALNTTSTADISFMLLIFFLVTTNMDIDKGLPRQLPLADKQEQQETVVAKGTVLALRLTEDNRLLVNGQPADMSGLRSRVIRFVTQVGKRHIITVDAAPEASYDSYFHLQNELVAAYKQLRQATSRRLYKQDYARLSDDQRQKVIEECPQRIAEQYNPQTMARSTTAEAERGGQP